MMGNTSGVTLDNSGLRETTDFVLMMGNTSESSGGSGSIHDHLLSHEVLNVAEAFPLLEQNVALLLN